MENEIKDNNHEDDDQEYSGSSLCHPGHNCHRYFFLIFMCMLGIGNYFCYDVPGALQEHTIADIGIDTAQFTLLYALYNWPNTILSLFGGYLVDRYFGINWGAIIFCLFTFSGQFILGFGAYLNQFWIMCLGRVVFAIGGENLAVTSNMRAVKWFKGRELSMVFGLQLSVNRAGSTVNFYVMEPLYDYFHKSVTGHKCLGIVFMIVSVMTGIDLLLACILAIRDRRAERILKIKDQESSEKIRIKDVLDFKLDFWSITFIIIFYYVAIFPFVSLGIPFYKRKFGFTSSEANSINSIIYLISMVLSPFLGAFIGQLGNNITFVLFAVLVSWISHAMMAFTTWNPWYAMVLLGIGYSVLACTVWPMISLVIPENQLGTAYGIAQALQNLGLGLIVYAAGYIVDSKGYFVLEIFFLGWLSLAIIFIMVLSIYNESSGGFLNMTPRQRKKSIGQLPSSIINKKKRGFKSSPNSDIISESSY